MKGRVNVHISNRHSCADRGDSCSCDKPAPPSEAARPVRTVTVEQRAGGEIVSLTARAVSAAAITASKASDHAGTCGRSPAADSLAMG